ncbi:phosphotransferase enzyme family protein [Gorillibacterium timonense]|uniref:phosphotransferase enzyme family protein n=1 Tax=Gorillibacterium timonense TaxID=1689269 RepID=UPI00131D2292|nr:phosphotransferase [Gorillibacterium timonense]
MEKAVEIVYTEGIMDQALDAFGLSREGLKLLGDFENYVYEATKDGKAYILRLTHSSHRSPEEVESELDWVNHLIDNGVEVQAPLPSLDERYVVPVQAEDDTVFSVSLFEKAEGHHPRYSDPDEWNSRLFREWGRKTGEIHRATQTYVRPEHLPSRPHWDEDELKDHARDYINEGEEWMLDRLNALFDHLHSLPRDSSSYGLLHTDIHPGNFFVDGAKLRVFDFDDCSYNWYVHDLAIPLYYSVAWGLPESYEGSRDRFAADFFRAFWDGYYQEFKLDPVWLKEIPYLLKLRDLTLYMVINKKVSPEELAKNERLTRTQTEARDRIYRDVPIASLDDEQLIGG